MSLLVPTLTVQVIFSDETTVELGHKAKPFVRRSKGCRIREVHTVRNVTFARKVMFWGIISAKGPGCLVPVQGTLNAERYVNLLQQYLLPQAATWFPNSPWEFQQDNASCHKVERTMAFFHQQCIQLLDWAPYLPDVSPIENVWGMLKRKVYKVGSASTVEEVIAQAQHLWHNDSDIHNLCVSLCANMP